MISTMGRMEMSRGRAALPGMVFALLCAVSASAFAAAPDPIADAKELFQQAKAAEKKGYFEQALGLFRKSQHLRASAAALLNIADCEEKLGLTASAYQHFQEVTTQPSAGDDRLFRARKHIAALKPRLPWLRIDIAPGTPAGTRVTRDGIEVNRSSLGVDQPIDPGQHEIVVTTPNRPDRRYAVISVEGKHDSVTVEPGEQPAPLVKAVSSPEMKTPAVAPRRTSGAKTAGFALVGIGIPSLSASAVTGALAIVIKNGVEKVCPVPKQCSQAGMEEVRRGKYFATASTITFVAGLTALGFGTYLVLSNRTRPTTKAAMAPLVLPGGAGLATGGTF
jgi:hypothetical protein